MAVLANLQTCINAEHLGAARAEMEAGPAISKIVLEVLKKEWTAS